MFVLPLSDDAAEAGKNLEYLNCYTRIDRHRLATLGVEHPEIPRHGRIPLGVQPYGWPFPFGMMAELWTSWLASLAGLTDRPAPIIPRALGDSTGHVGGEATAAVRRGPVDGAWATTDLMHGGGRFTAGR